MIWNRTVVQGMGTIAIPGLPSSSTTPERIPPSFRLLFVPHEPGPAGGGAIVANPELYVVVWAKGGKPSEPLYIRGMTELEFPYPIEGLAFVPAQWAPPDPIPTDRWIVYGSTEGERILSAGNLLPLRAETSGEAGVVTSPSGRSAAGVLAVQRPVLVGGVDAAGLAQNLPVAIDGDNAPLGAAMVGGILQPGGTAAFLPLVPAPGAGGTGVHVVPTTEPAVQLYDSGSVPGGAAIDSGVLDISRYTGLAAMLANASAVTARLMVCYTVRDDASQQPTQNVNVPISACYTSQRSRTATGDVSGMTSATKNMRFLIGAAGADAARLTIWGMP